MMIMAAFLSFCGGALIAAGLFSLVTTSRVINRMLDVAKVSEYSLLAEEMIILGAILGNISYVYGLQVGLGLVLGAIYMAFAGIFCGAILVALAEVIKTIPIFVRRVRISGGFGYMIAAFALGKILGAIIEKY